MELLVILVLILINGLISMSEIPIVSLRKARLEIAAKRGDKRAQVPHKGANSSTQGEAMFSEIPFSTVSGLILHELRTLPVTGQKVQWLQFEFEVVDMDKARIDKVLLKKIEQ